MERIDHNLDQGSDAWNQFRLEHFGASEAAAMLGISPYMTRTELLKLKKSGIAKEFSDFVQSRILDKGHEVEALARPIIEARIGEDLYPVTCSRGLLSASCDGLTMDDSTGFECKQYSKDLFDAVNNGIVPDHHLPQVQQCLYVTGAEKWVFTVSDGTEENTCSVDVYPDPEYIQMVINGWAQFEKDLADFVPVIHVEKPVAEPVKALPALSIQIKGEVSLSNLPVFKQAADQYIANIKTDLQNDQDFANAKETVKFLGDAEKKLESAKEFALSQTADIDELMKTIDYIKDGMRTKRLALDKLVKTREDQIRVEIVQGGRDKLNAHLQKLNAEIKPVVVTVDADFGGVIKSKRTIESLHNAIDTEVARCVIDADAKALIIRENLAYLNEAAADHKALFADLTVLGHQNHIAFKAIVDGRIAEFVKAEQAKAEAAKAAQAAIAQAAQPSSPPAAETPIVMNSKTVSVPAATPKFSAKPTPSLAELASKIAFEYSVDVRTATAWIVAAVNQYGNQEAA